MENKELMAKALGGQERGLYPLFRIPGGSRPFMCGWDSLWGLQHWKTRAFGPSCCAERTAFFKAVSEGKREFSAIAIVGGPAGKEPEDFCPPCGVCRQVMMEFCDPERFRIVLGKGDLSFREYTLKELLPLGFAGDGVERKE